MKFEIEKNILLDALNIVSRAISSRTTNPTLNGIKFELKKEGLYLIGSDSELSIRMFIEEKKLRNIEQIGGVVIHSKYIIDIIRKISGDVINFELINNNVIKIFTENNEFELSTFNIDEYPMIKFDDANEPINIKSCDLKKLINKTSYAISTQDVRPWLKGINFKINKDILEFVATDSYRLSKSTYNLDKCVSNNINIIIPGRSIIEIEKILNDDDTNIIMNVFNNKMIFLFDNVIIQTNLLSGNFPDPSMFIPSEYKYIIDIKLQSFYDAVDRTTILALNKEKNRVKMIIKDKEMILNSISEELGKTEEIIPIESTNPDEIEIGFSSQYMLDALKTFNDERLLLLINADDKPIIIKSTFDENTLGLIVPIKVY